MSDDLARLGVVIDTSSVSRATSDMHGFERAAHAAAQTILGLVSTATLYQLAQMADAWTRIENQLRIVTASTRQFNAAMTSLYEISQRTYTRVQEMSELFSTLTRTTREVGVSAKDTAILVEMIAQAGKLGGTSAAGYAAALTQLNQALQSGVLRGEEFNSLNEQAPPLIKALADGLGVAQSALRGMAETGALTTEKILPALLKQAPAIAEQFKSMQITMSDGWVIAGNSMTQFVGELDNLLGASSNIANFFRGWADAVDKLSSAIRELSKNGGNTNEAIDVAIKYGLMSKGGNLTSTIRSDALALKETLEFVDSLDKQPGAGERRLKKDSGLILGLVQGDVETQKKQQEQMDALNRAIEAGDKAMERYGVTADQAARALKRLQLAADPLKAALHDIANEMALLAVPEGLEREIARRQQQVAEAQAKAGLPITAGGTGPQVYAGAISAAAKSAGLDPALMYGLMLRESSGIPAAVNPSSGAMGLFQFMPETAQRLHINPMDPEQAISGAAKYLKELLDQFGGDMEKALAAYGGFKTKDPSAYISDIRAKSALFPGSGEPPSLAAGVTATSRMALGTETAALDRQRMVVELLTTAQGAATDSQTKMAEAQRVGLVAAQVLNTENASTLDAWMKEIRAGASLTETLGMLNPKIQDYAQSLEKMDAATAAQETQRLRMQLEDQTAALEATTKAQIDGGEAALRRARIETQVAQAMQTSTEQAANLRKELEAQEKLTQTRMLGQFQSESERRSADVLARAREFRQGDIAVELGDLQRAARDKERDTGPGTADTYLKRMLSEAAANRQMTGAQLDRQYDPHSAYQSQIAELQRLREEGAITADTLEKATRDAYTSMLDASENWTDGAIRGLRQYSGELTKWSDVAEKGVTTAMSSMEDALISFTRSGKANFKDMVSSMLEDLARLVIRQSITGPLAGAISKGIGGLFNFSGGFTSPTVGVDPIVSGSGMGMVAVGHTGWRVGMEPPPDSRRVPMALFAGAPRYHGGGEVGPTPWLAPGERPIIAQDGEEVLTASQRRALRAGGITEFYAIDARGSNDPAAVEAAVDRAMAARIPGVIKMSAAAAEASVVDRSRRRAGRM